MKSFWTCALLLMAGALGVEAESSLARITFEGDSTLHGFSGHAHSDQLRWEKSGEHTYRVALRVPARSLTTDLAARDKNMWKLLEVDAFPQLAGDLDGVPADWLNHPQPEPLTRSLALTIRDRTHSIPAQVNLARDETGAQLDVSFVVSLQRYGLRAPSVLGLMRVRDTVDVRVQVPLPREKDSTP